MLVLFTALFFTALSYKIITEYVKLNSIDDSWGTLYERTKRKEIFKSGRPLPKPDHVRWKRLRKRVVKEKKKYTPPTGRRRSSRRIIK